MTFGDRHSGQHRPPTHPHEVAGPERHHEHHAGAEMTDDQAEALASKMVEVSHALLVDVLAVDSC